MRIMPNHPARAAVAGLDTYHDGKGRMLTAVDKALRDCGIEADLPALVGPDGYTTCTLRPVRTEKVVCECCARRMENELFDNCLVIAWYTMPSGRIELTSYIS